jgi:hypothetical protein
MSIWIDRVTSTITPSVFHQSIHDQDRGLDRRQIERVKRKMNINATVGE